MRQKILGFLVLPLVAGCSMFSIQEAAPVVSLENTAPTKSKISRAQEHIVQSGESLYSIAWRYGRDYRDVAVANNIAAPYTIYPGQKLSMNEPSSLRAKLWVSAKKKTTPQLLPENPSNQVAFKGDWVWPVHGNIIKHYSAQTGAKGIDIAGNINTPVHAAGSGKVVYSGAGLRGYGQLIIIKHNDTYLSAYAHNSQLLVKEGDPVNKAQVIAMMGKTDADQVKLHFEIRKNGKPINPLNVLPASASI